MCDAIWFVTTGFYYTLTLVFCTYTPQAVCPIIRKNARPADDDAVRTVKPTGGGSETLSHKVSVRSVPLRLDR
jgi:hypothetical protein